MFRINKIFLLIGSLIATNSGGGVAADFEIVDLIPQKIYSDDAIVRDGDHHLRSLQLPFTCNNYEFTVEINDDLRMSYVVRDDRIKVELEFDGEAWISLGTNPTREGKMVGAEAWVALPSISTRPSIYDLNGRRISSIESVMDQTLENGSVSQSGGVTLMQFDKLLSDGDNVSINGNANVVFIWAIGRDNTFGRHVRRGAFRLALETCTAPVGDIEEVELDEVCGFFGRIFGRFIGRC